MPTEVLGHTLTAGKLLVCLGILKALPAQHSCMINASLLVLEHLP